MPPFRAKQDSCATDGIQRIISFAAFLPKGVNKADLRKSVAQFMTATAKAVCDQPTDVFRGAGYLTNVKKQQLATLPKPYGSPLMTKKAMSVDGIKRIRNYTQAIRLGLSRIETT